MMTGAALLAVRALLNTRLVLGPICWLPFVLLIIVSVLGFMGLAYSIYPFVVIPLVPGQGDRAELRLISRAEGTTIHAESAQLRTGRSLAHACVTLLGRIHGEDDARS